MKKYLLITSLVFISSQTMAAEFTANELCKTFSSNGAIANQKYKNKRITVSGRMTIIKLRSSYWRVGLQCDRKSGMKGVRMKVYNSASAKLKPLAKAKKNYRNSSDNDFVAEYKRGENIKFSCKYQRYNKAGVYLKDCSIN